MLHYYPRHISNINMPIFRRTNCIITESGIVTLCKRLYSMPDESRLQSALTCPSSEGQIALSQHLVSSLSVNGCTVCRMRTDYSAVCSHPAYRTLLYCTESEDTRCCDNTICPPEDGHINARNMSRIIT